MMDGRFDQQFAELFAASVADKGKKGERLSRWPLVFAVVAGLSVFVCTAVLA